MDDLQESEMQDANTVVVFSDPGLRVFLENELNRVHVYICESGNNVDEVFSWSKKAKSRNGDGTLITKVMY